jgi:hypothetical protein
MIRQEQIKQLIAKLVNEQVKTLMNPLQQLAELHAQTEASTSPSE